MESKETVSLVIKNEIFECSKNSLVLSSDYFKAMFTSNFVESQQSSVEIKNVEPDTMKIILNYIDEGSLNIIQNIDISLSVLQCASMLQFSKIQKLCEDFLIQELSSRNCLQIYETTLALSNLSVSEPALTFALWWFADVVESEYFLNLSVQDVENYLSKPELNLGMTGEWTVWEAILKWIEYDESKRSKHISTLLHCLDFSNLFTDDISNMMFYDIVSSNTEAIKILEAIKSYLKCPSPDVTMNVSIEEKELRELAKKTVNKDKNMRRCFPSVPCVVCYKKRQIKGSGWYPAVCFYVSASRGLEQLVPLSKMDQTCDMCVGFRVCSVGPSIFVTGGQYVIGGSIWNNDVWSYNIITSRWQVHPSLPRPRRSHMVCVLGSVIYLLGGYGKHRISLDTMDAYDLASGNWLECPNVPFNGVGAICSFKNRILVFANCSLYTFYPERSIWVPSPLKSDCQRSYTSAVSYEDAVYLLGAHSQEVYRLFPDTSDLEVHPFGSFSHETFNMCLAVPYLVSFSIAEDSFDRKVNLVETLSLEGEDEEGKRRAKVSWMESLRDTHSSSQTSHSHKESSYGCFPLFKLRSRGETLG